MRHLLLGALLPATLFANTLDLRDIPDRVRTHHPGLQAARLSIDEARGRQLGAGRPPNPSLNFDWRSESRLSPAEGEVAFEQSFPLTRRLSLEKKLTAQLVTAAELEVCDAERRLIAGARVLAVRLLALDQQRALRLRQKELAQKLAGFAQSRAEQGEVSPLDAAQAQVDARRFDLEVKKLEAERAGLLGALKPMLGIAPREPLTLGGSLPALVLPGVTPWQQRADYQLAQTQAQAAQTDAALAKSRRLQDVSLGIVGGPERQYVQDQGRQSTGFIGFRVSIPLPLWNRNQGEIVEKNATAERQRLEAAALAAQITGEADTARREMQATAALVRETRDQMLPLVLEQNERLEKAYEAGQTDLITLLRARDQQLQIEAAALDAERDFHLARIRYEAAIGKP